MERIKSFTSKYILYLIATPIGNLKEMTPRALEILSSADLVAAEDTRNASLLLSQFNIKKPCYSLREHNEKSASEFVVQEILKNKKVVYMSDAGYPCISDPGNILANECIKNNIAVSTVCGSSACLNALVASGLETSHFYFYGFLSPKENEAKTQLKNISSISNTIIFYESPHRIEKTLHYMSETLGDRKIVLARELTKLNEEYIRGNINEFLDFDFNTIKGEIVLIVEGNCNQDKTSNIDINSIISIYKEKGISNKDIVDLLVKLHGIKKNLAYQMVNDK